MSVYVEILSGPRDGFIKEIADEEGQVLVGNNTEIPNVSMIVDDDPHFPEAGVRLQLQESGIRVADDNRVSDREYGEHFQLGQTWLRVWHDQTTKKEA